MEIYKERVIDLLGPSNTAPKASMGSIVSNTAGSNLRIRETPGRGVWVEGVTDLVTAGAAEVNEVRKYVQARTTVTVLSNTLTGPKHCFKETLYCDAQYER